jgi:hypothetical protein
VGKKPLTGVLRELFVIGSLQNAGYHVYFSVRDDIECNGTIFEIGGKNKGDEQIGGIEDAYLIKDDILSGGGKTLPLYLFGFLY